MEIILLFFYLIGLLLLLIIAVYLGRIKLYTEEIRNMLKSKFDVKI